VEWGPGVFGAQSAAKHYYGVSARQLNAAQAARLVVMLPNPIVYSKRLPQHAQKYAQAVLRRMPHTAIP
jgi:monofunctional glycosyltransferase